MVDLHLVERLLFETLGMDDESSLSNAAHLFFDIFFIVIVMGLGWKHWLVLSEDLLRKELSILAYLHESPIVESALPELTEVDGNLLLIVVDLLNVALLYLVPSQDMAVVSLDGGRGA